MKKKTRKTAVLNLVGSLQDFIATDSPSVEMTFELSPSVKDLIESKGIPHTAIFKLKVNGRQKTLDYNLQDGDEVKPFPFELVDEKQWDPIYSRPTAFIADVHLGKLVKTLRLLGFDTAYNKSWDDPTIIHKSNGQRRMILTRDLDLLKNGATRYGYWVRSTDPDQQIRELFGRFSLGDNIHSFSRCMKCNGKLQSVSLEQVENKVPAKVKKWHSVYWVCQTCGQVYWKGSHFEKLKKKVKELKEISG